MVETNMTVAASINDLQTVGVSAAILAIGEQYSITDSFARRDTRPGERSVVFPAYGSVTASATTEGQEVTRSEITTSGVTLTPTTSATFRCTLTDLGRSSAPQSASDFGTLAGAAIALKRNQDAWALFAGLSQSVGSGASGLDKDSIIEGRRIIRQAGGVGTIFLCLSSVGEEQLLKLYTAVLNANIAESIKQATQVGGQLPAIYGVVPIIAHGVVADTGTVTGGMYVRQAFGYSETSDWGPNGLKAVIEPRAALIGNEMVFSASYDIKEVYDTWGVRVIYGGSDVIS